MHLTVSARSCPALNGADYSFEILLRQTGQLGSLAKKTPVDRFRGLDTLGMTVNFGEFGTIGFIGTICSVDKFTAA